MSEDSNPSPSNQSDQPKQAENDGKQASDARPARKAPKAARKSAKKPSNDRKPQEVKKADGQSQSSEPAVEGKESMPVKGQSADSSKAPSDKDSSNHSGRRRRSRNSSREGNTPKTASKHDPELVAKYAWKIYLAEISEEGVTLIDDRTAKELARRCFELAGTFLDEQQKQS